MVITGNSKRHKMKWRKEKIHNRNEKNNVNRKCKYEEDWCEMKPRPETIFNL